jgi:hypothetical protein
VKVFANPTVPPKAKVQTADGRRQTAETATKEEKKSNKVGEQTVCLSSFFFAIFSTYDRPPLQTQQPQIFTPLTLYQLSLSLSFSLSCPNNLIWDGKQALSFFFFSFSFSLSFFLSQSHSLTYTHSLSLSLFHKYFGSFVNNMVMGGIWESEATTHKCHVFSPPKPSSLSSLSFPSYASFIIFHLQSKLMTPCF